MALAFKEPAKTVCHSFEAFSGGCILLELKMISFLPMIFKLFFRVAGLAHLLRTFSRFFSHFFFFFFFFWNKEQCYFAGPHYLLGNCF